jgi:RNA polymerase sigma factor (sigma-70 family)
VGGASAPRCTARAPARAAPLDVALSPLDAPAPDAVAEAMERYADGDVAAFEVVYRAVAPAVRACLRHWTQDQSSAEDLLQETFLRVHRARDRYRTGAPVGPWVLTIARRLAIDALRRRAHTPHAPSRRGELPDPGAWPTPIDELDEAARLVHDLREAIALLPDTMRPVVALHHLEGQPLPVVAASLGISPGAARVRAHRGYARLRETLAHLVDRLRG